MKLSAAGKTYKTAPVEVRERELTERHQIIAAPIGKLNAEDEQLSVEQRKERWMPDPFATPSNFLSTSA